MTEAYRVPKHRVAATVGLAGIAPLGVDLFLAHSARTGRPERPSDLLKSTDVFLPVAHVDGGLSFVKREAIAFLTVPVEFEQTGDTLEVEDLAADLTRKARITVILDDEQHLTGTVCYLMPDNQSRLLDYLNSREEILTLFDEDVVHIVNKEFILRVIPE